MRPTAPLDPHNLRRLRQHVANVRDMLMQAADSGQQLLSMQCRALGEHMSVLAARAAPVQPASLRLTAVAAVLGGRALASPYRALEPMELMALVGRLSLAIDALSEDDAPPAPATDGAIVIDLAAFRAARARPAAGPAPLPPPGGGQAA